MSFVSLLGLVTMLLLAWAISYHRRKVQIRPIIWGMSLQFLFAFIILQNNYRSFAGMVVLAGLLVAYSLNGKAAESGNKMMFLVGALAVSGLLGAALYYLLPTVVLGWLILALLVFMPVNSRWSLVPAVQRFLPAGLIVMLVTYLIQRGLYGQTLFKSFSDGIATFLSMSDYGAKFLFANFASEEHYFPASDTWPGFGFLFAFKVLPTIVFFGGFMSVLYYMGIMQKVISVMSRFMRWSIGTSGAETLSCSANVFVGQTEAPLLIRPFLKGMTQSELLTVMVGGFATIAGGVLAGYISMGVSAGHLVAASVMSAPAALVIGKIIFPETEHSETAGDVELPEIPSGSNVLEAASNGITDGLKLAVNVGAMLLGFTALIAVGDLLLNWTDGLIDGRLLGGAHYDYRVVGLSPATGEFAGIFPGSLQTFFGTLLAPLAWLMGVPWEDAAAVGNLLGVKLSLNEFVAFGSLGTYIQDQVMGERATVIATYALCGFANFSSIGIQIGGLSALAPERKSDLAKVGLKAMFGGAFASWTTACIAGLFI